MLIRCKGVPELISVVFSGAVCYFPLSQCRVDTNPDTNQAVQRAGSHQAGGFSQNHRTHVLYADSKRDIWGPIWKLSCS